MKVASALLGRVIRRGSVGGQDRVGARVHRRGGQGRHSAQARQRGVRAGVVREGRHTEVGTVYARHRPGRHEGLRRVRPAGVRHCHCRRGEQLERQALRLIGRDRLAGSHVAGRRDDDLEGSKLAGRDDGIILCIRARLGVNRRNEGNAADLDVHQPGGGVWIAGRVELGVNRAAGIGDAGKDLRAGIVENLHGSPRQGRIAGALHKRAQEPADRQVLGARAGPGDRRRGPVLIARIDQLDVVAEKDPVAAADRGVWHARALRGFLERIGNELRVVAVLPRRSANLQ